LAGFLVRGVDTGIIDLIVVSNVDEGYLLELINKIEALILRKIRTLVLSKEEPYKLTEKLEVDKDLVVRGDQ